MMYRLTIKRIMSLIVIATLIGSMLLQGCSGSIKESSSSTDNPGGTIPDPTNPASLFPITFDAIVVEAEEGSQTVFTVVDGTDNSSEEEH